MSLSPQIQKEQSKVLAPPKKRLWLILVAVALFALIGWVLVDLIFVPGKSTRAFDEAVLSAHNKGLAPTFEKMQVKYPSTPEGENAIREIARISGALNWKYDLDIFARGTKLTSHPLQFDVGKVIEANTSIVPSVITEEGLRRYVNAN